MAGAAAVAPWTGLVPEELRRGSLDSSLVTELLLLRRRMRSGCWERVAAAASAGVVVEIFCESFELEEYSSVLTTACMRALLLLLPGFVTDLNPIRGGLAGFGIGHDD